MGPYIENAGRTPVRFLEMFKSSYYADVSLEQWMALTPPEFFEAHLNLDPQVMRALRKHRAPSCRRSADFRSLTSRSRFRSGLRNSDGTAASKEKDDHVSLRDTFELSPRLRRASQYPADAKQRHREIAGFFDQRAERAWADGSVAHCVYSGGPRGAYCWPTSPE